ncbi:MAG: AtpZ/AtpI family protein [Deltaproteobacteria bacterium]|nr:AtpZ/AtpI family protein [Deltaproteobacteria bacterium]
MKKKRGVVFYDKNREWAENLSVITQLGLSMVGCVLFCFFIGRWLDTLARTKGIFITVFIILGIIGGGNVVYRQILEITDGNYKNRWKKSKKPKKDTHRWQ